MLYDICVPAEFDQALGQALLRPHGHSSRCVVAERQSQHESFADRCRRALAQGVTTEGDDLVVIGCWDESLGQVRLRPDHQGLLSAWLGQPVSRRELEASDSQANIRAQARQDFRRSIIQGNTARAAQISQRHGIHHW
jgi:hypothetical protein